MKTLFRFIVSGALAALTSFITLYIGVEFLHVWYVPAVVFAYGAGFAVSFSLQKLWTFSDHAGRTARQLTLYVLLNAINICLNIGIVFMLVERFHVWYLAAEFAALAVIAVWSFLVMRFVIFLPARKKGLLRKVAYIVNARMPTERAHGIQIASMCAAFAGAGIVVELIVPKRFNTITEDIFAYYGIEPSFTVVELPAKEGRPVGTYDYYLRRLFFALRAARHVVRTRPDAVFTRDEISAWLTSFSVPTFFELHRFPETSLGIFFYFLRNLKGIVSTNIWKRDELIRRGIDRDRILVAPNGFDSSAFERARTLDLREMLRVPSDSKLVMYTGQLFGWKGAHILAKAIQELPTHVHAVFIGGNAKETVSFKEQYAHPRIHVLGQKPHHEMPAYQVTADLLVVPNVPINRESSFETSPIKLFEYMASKRPIVASDLPSIREIVNGESVLLVEPNDPHALAKAIERVLENPAVHRVQKAYELSLQYSWKARAGRLLAFMETRG